jgi:PAS domain S-box-containing protein
VVFAVVAALILPVGYFVMSYEHLMGIMDTEAEINAKLVSRLISTNPELWRYETVRIEELLARRPRSGKAETRRIFDDKNMLVAESVNSLPAPQVTVSLDVNDGGETVGRIEISRSILPIFLKSGILTIVGLGLGLLLYRLLPFQALIMVGRRLQDANDFMKKVMEGSTNSLVVLDPDGTIQMINGRFETLSGCSREELMGQPFCSLFTGDALSHVQTKLRDVLREGASNVLFETVLARRDGSERSLFCGVVPLLSDGSISGVVVSLDDITDRNNAEEARLELERHLLQTQKLESLGLLAGGIAHDFNNILSIITGYCYVIKDESDSESSNADYVQKIEDAANRAGDLCRQMLSYAGRTEMLHSLVSMNSLVAEMVMMLHSGIKKNVKIDLDLCDDLMIIADSSQIQQIVMNLIINAVEAIGDHNGTIRISLEKAEVPAGQSDTDFIGKIIPAGGYVCLEVSDNGCGMDKETQNRIFEPFYTTKFAGRGLGMSATLGTIRAHEGALQLASRPGDGTTFKVYLPLAGVSDSAENKSAVGQTPVATGTGTVLLVDDEEELRAIGLTWLEKIGYSALTAANGLEALTIYREKGSGIDLILLDLLMPDMDGAETYRRLREVSMTIPIVFCTGCSIQDLSTDILDDDCVGFLKKPYKPDQLRTLMVEMLG